MDNDDDMQEDFKQPQDDLAHHLFASWSYVWDLLIGNKSKVHSTRNSRNFAINKYSGQWNERTRQALQTLQNTKYEDAIRIA